MKGGSVDLAFIAHWCAWLFEEILIVGHRLVLCLAYVGLGLFIFVGCVDRPKLTCIVMCSSILAFSFLCTDVLRQNIEVFDRICHDLRIISSQK